MRECSPSPDVVSWVELKTQTHQEVSTHGP